ncbi:MAG TPA: hypothetical protein VGL94_20035 [Ktedonobacteraceae bacterium]|jgi:hypothetical protein
MHIIRILQKIKRIQLSAPPKEMQAPKPLKWAYPSLALLIIGLTIISGQLGIATVDAHNSMDSCIQGTEGYNGNGNYNSHSEPDGSDVSTSTASPSNSCIYSSSKSNQSPITILGQLTKDDLDRYCQQSGIPGASTQNPITTGGAQRDGDNAYAWTCHQFWTGTPGGDAPGRNLSMKAACQFIFNDNSAEDRLLNYWNTHPQHPTSSTDTTTDDTSAWECFTNATLVGGINLTKYCQSLGYQNYVHDGATAYDFRCTGNGQTETDKFDTMLAACQIQYRGYAYVIDRLAEDDGHSGYSDPTSWECWGSLGGSKVNNPNPSTVNSINSTIGQIKIYGLLTKHQLSKYCTSQGDFTSAKVIGNHNAYNWRCVSSDGQNVGTINMEDACRTITNDPQAEDRFLNYFDPNSWECFGNAHLAGDTNHGIYNLAGYCQAQGFQNMQLLASANAYSFTCLRNNGTKSQSPFQHIQDSSYHHQIPFSMLNACQWQYSSSDSSGIIDRLNGYNNVTGWQCWIGDN